MKKSIIVTILLVFALFFINSCKQDPGPDNCYWTSSPDAITGASAKYYRADYMLKDDALYSALKNPMAKQIFFVISTVRCDGTSNIAAVMPFAVSKDTIAIVFAPGTTTQKNIMATKTARAIVRYTDKKTAKGLDIFGNVGSRLLLQLQEDKKECKKLFKANEEMLKKMMARSAEDVVFLKIKEVYPLG